MAQLSLYIAQGEHVVDTIVVVQKDVPNNLLLGTDTLLHLGFTLLKKGLGTHMLLTLSVEKSVSLEKRSRAVSKK